jgi:hypothetical protein
MTSVALASLVACGGGSDTKTSTTPLENVFPTSLAVASPLDREATLTTAALKADRVWWASLTRWLPDAWAQGTPSETTAYQASLQRINAILNGSTPVANVIDPNRFLALETDATCFGPTITYNDYYSGTGTKTYSGNGELPSGDRGIWFDTEGTTTEACAAAQLNQRMDGAAQRSGMALRVLALVANAASGALPAVGATKDVTGTMAAITNLTWNSATLSQPSSGRYAYSVQATFSSGGKTHLIEVTLDHDPGASSSVYDGVLKYAVTNKFTGGNCPDGRTDPNVPREHDVTNVGTLLYGRNGSDMTLSHRSGQYCGASNAHSSLTSLAADRGATYGTDGQLDPSSKLAGGTGKGWGNNFSRFAADFDRSTEAGRYIYAWQAGPQDGHARTLQVKADVIALAATTVTGATAHFGYGSDIAAPGSGPILGMFCNWAAPAGAVTRNEFAQRQVMVFNGISNLWSVSSSNTLYAPTETCAFTDATKPNWYDRADDNSFSGNVVVAGTEASFLIGKGSSADIATAIGFTLPIDY